MTTPAAHNSARGQTPLEYLLLLAVVAVVVIASFSQGSLITQVHDAAATYYNTVTRAIMGSGTDAKPNPIAGGWCPVTCPTGSGPTVMYAVCECPVPAFGGAYCTGSGVTNCSGQGTTSCGPCPVGQSCNAAGQCVCSNGLNCSSIPNASPDPSCTKCDCNSYTYWDAANNSCDYCTAQNGQCYTSLDGISCTPVTCPNGQYCNASSNQCTSCPEGQTYNGTSCVAIQCPPNMYFDTNPSDPGYNTCACIAGYEYTTGPGCVACPNGNCNPCTPSVSCTGYNCGSDTCGNNCGPLAGACPGGQVCNSSIGPGTCINTCTSNGTCTVLAPCGSALGTDSCGGVCVGQANNCPPPGNPAETTCNLASLPPQCVCGTCIPDYECGSTSGHDACHNPCTAAPGVCPQNANPPYVCSPSFTCTTGCGACTPDFSCGSSSGHDDCGNPCTATPGTCPPAPYYCDNGECTTGCGLCTPDFECGSTSGHDDCGDPCTVPMGVCPQNTPPYFCNASNECTTGCTPNCSGKVCGDDGCGGSCGTCSAPGTSCNTSGQCVSCTPNCAGKQCGSDGCQGTCGTCSAPNTSCNASGQCACTPGTGCGTNTCGPDSCGNPDGCGSCLGNEACTNGQCVCTPGSGCGTNICGSDICGNPNGCGSCLNGQTCNSGQCGCAMGSGCGANTCGPDACGNLNGCGTCQTGQQCTSGQCVSCTAGTGCTGNVCGPDACGNPNGCGTCQGSETCTAGQCTCSCPNGETCNAAGQCTTTFTLQVSDYGNCKTCAPICTLFYLGGTCGTEADCGGQQSCSLNFTSCSLDSSDDAWNCGACLTETLVSGQGCPDGIASVVSSNITQGQIGTCGSNPTAGSASITYSVICNP